MSKENNSAHGYKLLFCLLCWFPAILLANNIQVHNVALTGQDVNQQFVMVSFDLSWDNSWRVNTAPRNWDAAWVFVKYRIQTGDWHHASLNYVNGNAATDGHVQPPGSTLSATPDGLGVFVYRSSTGTGNVSWEDLQLRWNYGADGVHDHSVVEVKVFAIEMVYVSQGNFRLGGGNGAEMGKFYEVSGILQLIPYTVTSEALIPVNQSSGSLYYAAPSPHAAGDQSGPIPAAFPKGYDAFYCMKYEVSQQQWVDFFNTLTPAQQLNNDLTDLDHRGPNFIDRNEISWEGFGAATTELPTVAVSFVEWSDVMAYLDWAGLRPMSELEYVKACRGPQTPIPEEYAWGTDENAAVINPFHYFLANVDETDEMVVNPMSEVGNANGLFASAVFTNEGPYRCGIFAASATVADRAETGATYYGIMEMTGNVSEMAVTVGDPQGRAFTGDHGDGALDTDGEADVPFWPLASGKGGGLFGGGWFSEVETLWINDRRQATVGNIGYPNYVGFRGVRIAP